MQIAYKTTVYIFMSFITIKWTASLKSIPINTVLSYLRINPYKDTKSKRILNYIRILSNDMWPSQATIARISFFNVSMAHTIY